MNETRAVVRSFILTSLMGVDGHEGESLLRDDQSLEGSHVVDSARMLEVFTFLEEQFGVVVENDEATPDNFDTVDAIVAFVERKRTPGTNATA